MELEEAAAKAKAAKDEPGYCACRNFQNGIIECCDLLEKVGAMADSGAGAEAPRETLAVVRYGIAEVGASASGEDWGRWEVVDVTACRRMCLCETEDDAARFLRLLVDARKTVG